MCFNEELQKARDINLVHGLNSVHINKFVFSSLTDNSDHAKVGRHVIMCTKSLKEFL